MIEHGKWITFAPSAPCKKTSVWLVKPKDGSPIGMVRWYGPWRKYCFYPGDATVYEQDCLRDIADFCERKTKEHKNAAAGRQHV